MSDIKKSLPKKELEPKIPEAPIGIGFNAEIKSVPTVPETPVVVEPAPDPKTVAAKKVKDQRSQFKKRALLWVRDIAVAVLVAILIMQFVRPTIVQQHSMEDTLHENDYIFLNRQAYNFGEIKHGDIFVFKYTPPLGMAGVEKNLIKRVIGLPGDEVSISGGRVFVNGKKIDDSYTKDGYTDGYMDPMKIPDGYIFAMGDNRQNSFDSRDPMLGLIDMRDVIGKAVFRAFPVGDAGLVN